MPILVPETFPLFIILSVIAMGFLFLDRPKKYNLWAVRDVYLEKELRKRYKSARKIWTFTRND